MHSVNSTPSRKSSSLILFAVLSSGLVISGCARSTAPDQYSYYETGAVSFAEGGKVVTTRNVKIAGTRTGIGAGVGAVSGGIGGSHIGNGGAGSFFGALGFALLGGLVGAAAEEAATAQSGIEYTIRGDDGRTLVIVQAQGGPVIAPGQRVTVIHSPERARVIPETQAGQYTGTTFSGTPTAGAYR